MKRGLTLVTISAIILVMLIITTTVTITGSNVLENSKKMKFASELLLMQETVQDYKQSNDGSLPIVSGSTVTSGNLPAGEYSKIDMSLLGLINTTYGREAKDDDTDIYVLSNQTEQVYYLKGLKIGKSTYYTLDDELKEIINYTDDSIVSKDGINFIESETEYTNKQIELQVQVPTEYTNVTVVSQNSTISNFEYNGSYRVYKITKASNFDVVVNYTKNKETLKQVYTVSNYDNEEPTISVKNKTVINDQTSISITTDDNLSGVKTVQYAKDKVEKTYFTDKQSGINVENNNVVLDKYTKYVTFFVEDNAGNSKILVVTLDTLVSEDDYVKYGLVVCYDGINNTGSGYSSQATTWKDLSGNGNDGTLVGFSYTSTSGWSNDHLVFDGTNTYVKLKNVLKDTSDFTIEYVIVQKQNKSYEYLWGLKTNYFGMESRAGGNRVLYYKYGSTIDFTSIKGDNTTLVSNTITKNSVKIKGYKNGEKLIENTTPSDIYTSGDTFNIGADGSGEYKMKADYYCFRIYNRVLTDDEIEQNYKVDRIRFGI